MGKRHGTTVKTLVLQLALTGVMLSQVTPSIAAAAPSTIEVSHWWGSNSEAQAIQVIKRKMTAHGVIWKDESVFGADGLQQKRVLQERINKKNPPDVMLSQHISHLAEGNLLDPINDIAIKNKWEEQFPDIIKERMKYKNQWFAVPINIQKFNTIWANKKIFDELKLSPPKTFDELITVSEKIKAAGYIPIALGGQAWQESIIFESLVLSMGGVSLFKRALVEFNPDAFKSKEMKKAIERVLKLRTFFDNQSMGREWNLATSMLIHDKAAMQVMGDWAKGQFLTLNKKPNQDFLCFPFPETNNYFIFSTDLFAVVHSAYKNNRNTQELFVNTIYAPEVQEEFNLIKGSIPARKDVSLEKFDDCAKSNKISFEQAVKDKKIVEHVDIRLSGKQRIPFYEAVSTLFHQPNITPLEAQQKFIESTQILKNVR